MWLKIYLCVLVLVVKLRQGLRVVAGGFPEGEVEGLYV
jgi:hypothetical protein